MGASGAHYKRLGHWGAKKTILAGARITTIAAREFDQKKKRCPMGGGSAGRAISGRKRPRRCVLFEDHTVATPVLTFKVIVVAVLAIGATAAVSIMRQRRVADPAPAAEADDRRPASGGADAGAGLPPADHRA